MLISNCAKIAITYHFGENLRKLNLNEGSYCGGILKLIMYYYMLLIIILLLLLIYCELFFINVDYIVCSII